MRWIATLRRDQRLRRKHGDVEKIDDDDDYVVGDSLAKEQKAWDCPSARYRHESQLALDAVRLLRLLLPFQPKPQRWRNHCCGCDDDVCVHVVKAARQNWASAMCDRKNGEIEQQMSLDCCCCCDFDSYEAWTKTLAMRSEDHFRFHLH